MSRGTTNIPIVGVLIKRGNKFLFVRRAHTGYQDGCYGLPAGHVEEGESFREAACREVLEEVGLSITPEQLSFRVVMHERHSEDVRLAVIFEVIDWHGEPSNLEPDKHDEIAWFDPAQLPKNLMKSLVVVFEKLATGQNYGEYGWSD